MKALILNSGMGKRMGLLTSRHPKCMTELLEGETILSRQLKLLQQQGIREIVITTGLFDQVLVDYCHSLELGLSYTFVNNPVYDKTNYIYSIELAKNALDDELVLMHGDLVFSGQVLDNALHSSSCMTVSSTAPLPEKDFKAVVKDGYICKVGVEFFEFAVAAQPLYHLKQKDWRIWLNRISDFCARDERSCYAENALNQVSDQCRILPLDVKDSVCCEIDTPEDLENVKNMLKDMRK